MKVALLLIVVLATSYFGSKLLFDRLSLRFPVVAGAEYLILGVLLGPRVSGILSPGVLDNLAPITSLAIGWGSAFLGARIALPHLRRIPGVVFRVAIVETVLTLALTTAALTYILQRFFGVTWQRVAVPGLTLGAMATTSAYSFAALRLPRTIRRAPLLRQLNVTSGMSGVLAIVTFGLMLAALRPSLGTAETLSRTEWALISITIGLVGGGLFRLFLGDDHKSDRLLASLLGGVTLVTGAATYLSLSPQLSALCFGVVLANTTTARRQIVLPLRRLEQPLYYALLILGGAAWKPTPLLLLAPVMAYLVVRALVILGSANLAARANGRLAVLGPAWGRGLLGQRDLAVAIAVNYMFEDVLILSDVVFAAALISLIITDLSSSDRSG